MGCNEAKLRPVPPHSAQPPGPPALRNKTQSKVKTVVTQYSDSGALSFSMRESLQGQESSVETSGTEVLISNVGESLTASFDEATSTQKVKPNTSVDPLNPTKPMKPPVPKAPKAPPKPHEGVKAPAVVAKKSPNAAKAAPTLLRPNTAKLVVSETKPEPKTIAATSPPSTKGITSAIATGSMSPGMALPLILRPGSRERPATRNGSEIGLSARRHNGASNVDSDDDSTSVYVSTTSASSVHFLVVSHNSGFCGSSHGVSKTPRLRHCLSVTISPISSAFTTPRLFFGGGGAAAGRARRAHSYNSDVDWISLNRQDTGEASPAAARVYKNAASGTKASPSHMKDWIPFSRTNSRSSATRGAFSSAVYASVLADVAAPTPKKQSRKGKHTAASPHTTHCSKLTPSDIGSSSTSVSTAGASSRRLSIEGNINKPHAYKEHDEVRSNGSGNCVNWSYPSEKQTAAVPVPAIKRFTDAIRYLQSQP